MQTSTLRTIRIPDEDLEKIKREFELRGTKSDFQRQTGVHRDTLSRIISRGKGNVSIVKKIMDYVNNPPRI